MVGTSGDAALVLRPRLCAYLAWGGYLPNKMV